MARRFYLIHGGLPASDQLRSTDRGHAVCPHAQKPECLLEFTGRVRELSPGSRSSMDFRARRFVTIPMEEKEAAAIHGLRCRASIAAKLHTTRSPSRFDLAEARGRIDAEHGAIFFLRREMITNSAASGRHPSRRLHSPAKCFLTCRDISARLGRRGSG